MTASKALIVVGLGYGDEGKGSIVDHLVRKHQAHTVVRFNGGAQAAHNVVTSDGRHHTFSQFGSGTLAGAETYLSRFMLVNPIYMFSEARHLQETCGVENPLKLVTVDQWAPITTPYHVAANRLREISRGNNRHGSCGFGIGETMMDLLEYGKTRNLYAKDLYYPHKVKGLLNSIRRRKLGELVLDGVISPSGLVVNSPEAQREYDIFRDDSLVDYCAEQYQSFAAQVKRIPSEETFLREMFLQGNVIFEGAQGVLLDENHGFHPYTTWSTTTFQNAETLIRGASYPVETRRIGVLRAYHTRHGAGPFVTEDPEYASTYTDAYNAWGPWQQGFRVGHFDIPAARYALKVVRGVDEIALTHLDQIQKFQRVRVCTHYETGPVLEVQKDIDLKKQEQVTHALGKTRPSYEWFDVDRYPENLETYLGTSITIGSFGPTAEDKRDL